MACARLNPRQREAVLADPCRPLLIVAAAGTGKTSTVAHRVAHMLAGGVPAAAVLVLAFSRQAVADFKLRLAAVLGEQPQPTACDGEGVQVHTFHGWSYRMLAQHWRRTGFGRPPSPVSPEEDGRLQQSVLLPCLRWAGVAREPEGGPGTLHEDACVVADEGVVAQAPGPAAGPPLQLFAVRRKAKLGLCREQACQWLGLPPDSPWPAVAERAASQVPGLHERWAGDCEGH